MADQILHSLLLPLLYFIYLYSSLLLFSYQTVNAAAKLLPPCTMKHFDFIILPCNTTTRHRSAVYYMNKNCDLKANGSINYPHRIDGLPCECQPGYGEQQFSTGKIECRQCQKGQFSHGGELIDHWKKWNGTNGVPGSGYSAYPYCSDFLTGKDCESWKPGGNFEYLVSGDVKNHSSELKCFEQSILVLTRHFVGEKGKNKIKFKFKVDGAPCRRGSTVCSNGLYFFVNGVKQMKKDVQFMWKEFSFNVEPGGNEFKFVYHHSCVKEDILDVAFIKHISMIGTSSPNTACNDCPAGSYSSEVGATECKKCTPGTYQDKPGQTTCLNCSATQFSRIGAIKCEQLPNCKKSDYYLLLDDISNCYKKNGEWMRKRSAYLPRWPGGMNYPCIPSKLNKPAEDPISCKCNPGFYLDLSNVNSPRCTPCKTGTYSDGTFFKCKTCLAGTAAVPGFYLNNTVTTGLYPKNETCTGQFCDTATSHWQGRGSYLATARLPGNFEIQSESGFVDVSYHAAKISFKCSVDCRMSPNDNRLAKHDHCYLKFIIKRGRGKQEEIVKSFDCVNHYRPHLRNGTKVYHEYRLPKPGSYNFLTLFHHEDEANYSLVSYEARIYDIQLFGMDGGSAKSCEVCPAGTKLSANKTFCIKCPNGTYSKNASSKCTPCPDFYFADKEGSAKCTPCGKGTKSNKRRDGCDYNGCKYSPVAGTTYDLSPLKMDGGSMYKVETYDRKSAYHFPLIYYVNICSQRHDNSSCMSYKRKMDIKTRKLVVSEETFLRTMACKRWSFDSYHSYSIGEVLNFLPLEGNMSRGLMINLTGGYKCFHKGRSAYVSPSTSILMECDLSAGVGRPEPRSNVTAIDVKHCHFELRWKTLYACPLCTNRDYISVQSKCINGSRLQRRTRVRDCRPAHGVSITFTRREACEAALSQTPLIITIVVAIILIGILIIFVIYYIRRNRALRGRLFKKAFHKVNEEDEDELVDNMQPHFVIK